MTPKELKQVKKVEKLVKKWIPRLLLQEWGIKVEYSKDPPGPGVILYVEPDSDYLNATIYVCDLFEDLSDTDKENVVIHELVHIVTAEFSGLFHSILEGNLVTTKQKFSAEERLTQRLTRIFVKVNNK